MRQRQCPERSDRGEPAGSAAPVAASLANVAVTATPAAVVTETAPVLDVPQATPEPAASVVRNGSEVVVTGTPGNDTFEFVAGATENTVIVQGQSYVFAAAEVTTFRFVGGGGNDTAKLTASGLASLAETAQLQPGSAMLQGAGYTVEVTGVQNVAIDGRGEGVQAALFDSAGDDSLVAEGDVASLSGDGFVETVSGFNRVQASALAGGHDTLRELAFDHLLETVGNWIEGLEAVFQADVQALRPEVGAVEDEVRPRRARQNAGRELRGVDVGVDLIARPGHVAPVQERVT